MIADVPSTQSAAGANAADDAVVHLGRGAVIVGALYIDGDLTVEGRINGDVHASGNVTVADTGRIDSSIEAPTVTIGGIVGGTVVTRRLRLAGSARLHGGAQTSALVVGEGATIEGTINVDTSLAG